MPDEAEPRYLLLQFEGIDVITRDDLRLLILRVPSRIRNFSSSRTRRPAVRRELFRSRVKESLVDRSLGYDRCVIIDGRSVINSLF